jgi:hypothetical protein
MENLINEYVQAVRECKQAETAFNLCDAEFSAVAALNLTAAEKKVGILYNKIKEAGTFAEFESTFRRAAWRNIADGIRLCDRAVR